MSKTALTDANKLAFDFYWTSSEVKAPLANQFSWHVPKLTIFKHE